MPDECQDFTRGSADLLKIMMLTGAAVGIFSVFQPWFSLDYGIVQFGYTGYDLFTRHYTYPDSGYFIYAPLVVLAASALSVIPSVLSFTKHEMRGAAGGIVSGIVILTSVSLYILYPESEIRVSSQVADLIGYIKLMDHADAGVYSAIIGGIFLIVGGMTLILHRRIRSDNEDAV
ncbi:MAG: hypothetical protein LBU30_01305 [Candidatus Methanoplasma sp.]|jgi:hypothetical protein|nr:hypothetical protein [Candidatus Methanoplasma sp.]